WYVPPDSRRLGLILEAPQSVDGLRVLEVGFDGRAWEKNKELFRTGLRKLQEQQLRPGDWIARVNSRTDRAGMQEELRSSGAIHMVIFRFKSVFRALQAFGPDSDAKECQKAPELESQIPSKTSYQEQVASQTACEEQAPSMTLCEEQVPSATACEEQVPSTTACEEQVASKIACEEQVPLKTASEEQVIETPIRDAVVVQAYDPATEKERGYLPLALDQPLQIRMDTRTESSDSNGWKCDYVWGWLSGSSIAEGGWLPIDCVAPA
ncbi:unnamed protein product, partial [Effrenium voratum]